MGQERFARLLELEMDKRGLSIRKLGFLTDPFRPELGRRRAQRHLSGMEPDEVSRAVYARILDAPHLAKDET